MRRLLAGIAFTVACIAITVALFGRAYPLVDAGLRLTREDAIARARALAARERLAPARARAAARFETNDTLSTYVDLAAGGPDSVRSLGASGLVPVFTWAVRLFEPGSARETIVRFAPDGSLAGVQRVLAQDERRPYVSESEGRLAADTALAHWGTARLADWHLVSTSYRVVPRSERVERTYVYERVGRRVGDAPVRADVTIVGDSAGTPARSPTVGVRGVPLGVRVHAQIPEAFLRRYGEMRSANELYADLTVPGMGVFLVAALIALGRLRGDGIRWRPATVVGGVVGALLLVASLDAIPGSWFDYDTATSPTTFVTLLILGAVATGVGSGAFVATVLAAAEALTRHAFPTHYDWWGYWRHRGAPPVARRILGGYALAAFGFAYVTVFYVTTRALLGWWVPTGTLDDPNQIASPLPWVSALGVASFAGTWEESIFRAVPLAILSLATIGRPRRRLWMALGIVVTALVFGFGHANYQSWPAYSRGAELFLEASLWAVLYLRVGLPTTIVGHVLYDLTWFGLFSVHGSGVAYRVTFAIVATALCLPLLAVAQGWLARRRALARGANVEDAPRFADWRAPIEHVESHVPEAIAPTSWSPTRAWRAAGIAIALVGALTRVGWPRAEALGAPFATRTRAVATADSLVRARGGDPSQWRRFVTVDGDASPIVRRFLEQTRGTDAAIRTVVALAPSYLPSAWWEVRYARTTGTLDARAEQWVARVLPNGAPLDVQHVLPEARAGSAPSPANARALAAAALDAARVSRASLHETEVEQTPRPARTDTRVEYVDSAVALPGGASARMRVVLAGTEVTTIAHRIRLPETFLRTERDRASRRTLAVSLVAVVGLVLVGALVSGALRHAPVLPALASGRQTFVAIGAAAGLASLAGWVNRLPDTLAAWPSEQPWNTFLATSGLSAIIAGAVAGVLVASLWGLTDGLRRRAGIAFWPAAPRDAMIAGAAFGLGAAAVPFALARVADAGWPVLRTTALGALAPWLQETIGIIPTVLALPTVATIALAFIIGVRGTLRIVVAVIAIVAIAAGAAIGTPHPAIAAVAASTTAAAAIALFALYGRQSGAAWVVAALAVVAVRVARDLVVAETGADVASCTLALIVVAIATLIWRRAMHRRASRAVNMGYATVPTESAIAFSTDA